MIQRTVPKRKEITSPIEIRPKQASCSGVNVLTPKESSRKPKASNYNLLSSLRELYSLPDPQDVQLFLGQHPLLLNLLQEAPSKISEYFPGASLSLQVVSDYEIPDWRKLVIYISTDLDVDEVIDRLNSLDEEWWLDAWTSNPAGDEIFIDLDF